ncbi:UNVERIFIED_CONTAM: GRAM domain-containing protein [Hammondia hammondi]|eukprot:XP_008885820.1 GRAM domain-containing protein [Hammondia hammondi]
MASSAPSVPLSSASSSSPSAPCSPCSSLSRSGAHGSSTICVESDKPLDPLLQLLEEQRGATKALERFCQDVVAAENDLMHALSKAKGLAADSCAPACLSPADARKHLQELLLLHGSQKQGAFAACSLSPPSPSSSPSLAASWTHAWEGGARAREEEGEAHAEGGREEQERGRTFETGVSPDSVASDVKPEDADPTDGRGQVSQQGGKSEKSSSSAHAPFVSLASRPELTPSAESAPKSPQVELSPGSSPSTAPASAALPPSPSVSALESPFLGFSSSPSPSALSCSPVSFCASPATPGPVASPLRACVAGPPSASEAVPSLQETYGPCEELVALVGRSLFFFVCGRLQHHAELRMSFVALAKAAANQQTCVHAEKSRLEQLLPKLTSSFRLARERKTRAFSRYEKAVSEAEAAVVSRERLKTQNLNSVCASGAASAASGASPFWGLSASQTPFGGAPSGPGQVPGRGGGAGAAPGTEALGSSPLAAPRLDAGKSQREKAGPAAVSLLLPQLQRQNQRADQLFQVYVQSRREYGAASVAAAKAAASLQAVVAHLWAEEQEFLEREFLRKQKSTLVGVFRTLARFVGSEEKAERALESGLAEAQKALLPAVTRCLVGDSDATRFGSRVFVIGDARQQEGEREGRGAEGAACEREARVAEHGHGGGSEGREGRDVDNAAREVEKKGESHAGKLEGKNTSACGDEETADATVDAAAAGGTPWRESGRRKGSSETAREQEEETRGMETRKKAGDSEGTRPETERCRSDEKTAGAELSSVLADARDLCERLRASNRRLQSMRSLVRLLIQSLCTYQKALLAAASSLGSASAAVPAGPDAVLAVSVSGGFAGSAAVAPSRGAEPLLMAGCCWQLLQACVGEVSEVCDTLRTCAGEYLLRLLDESVSQQQSTIRKLASAEGDMLRLLTASRAAKLETLNKLAKVKAVPGSTAPPEEAGRHCRRRVDSESAPCPFAVSRASPASPEAPSSSSTVSSSAACETAAGGELIRGEGGVAVQAPHSEPLSAASADVSSSLELLQALSERSADQEVIAAGRVKKLMKTVVAGEAQRSGLLLLQAKAVHQASIEAVSVAAAECRAASQLAERAHERQAFVRWLAEVFPVAERSVLRGLEGRRNSTRRVARRAERKDSACREEEDVKAKPSGVCRQRSPTKPRGSFKRAQLPNNALNAILDGERSTDRDPQTLERDQHAVASGGKTTEETVEETLADSLGARHEGEETPGSENLESKGKCALNSYASLSLQTAPSTTSLAEQRPAASEVPLSPAEVAGRKELRAVGLDAEKQETERQGNEQSPTSSASPGASSFGTEQPSLELLSSSSLCLSSGTSSPGRIRREVRPRACRRGSRSLSEESFAFSPPSSLPESPASSLRHARTRGEFPGSSLGEEKKQRHKLRERETRRANELERPPTVLVAAAERMKRVEQAALWWRDVVRLSSPPSPVSSLSSAVSGSAGSSERARLISCVEGKEVCERDGAGKRDKMKTAEEYEKDLPVSAVMALEEGTVKLKCAALCDFDGSEFDALTASSFSSAVRRDGGSSHFFFRRGDILRVTIPVGSLWEGLDPRGVAGVFPASCVFVPADSVWAPRPAMQDKDRGSLERLVLDFFSASRSSSSSSASPLFHPASAGAHDTSPRRSSKEDDPDDGEGLALSSSERQTAALPGLPDTPRPGESAKSEEPACELAEEAVEPRRLPSTRVAPLCFAPTRRIQPHRKRREIRNEGDSGRDVSPRDSQSAERHKEENLENGEEGETKAKGGGEEAREELETPEEVESERKAEKDGEEEVGEDGRMPMHFRKGYSEDDATYIEREKRLRATPLPGLASGEEGEDREITGPGGSRLISRAESAVTLWYREGVDGRPTGDSTAAAAAAVAASLSSYDRLQQEEFRQRFGIAEFVLQSYSCALSRRILLQGRLYVTQNTLAFFSFFNETTIFGLETVLVIKMQDIVAVRKKVNAFFFDNSIEIELTDDRRHFFATFINRDKAFDFILALWEIHKRMLEHGSRRTLESPLYEEERHEDNASEQSPASEKQSQQPRRRRFVAVKADAAAPFPSDPAAADRLILEVQEALEKRAKREGDAEGEGLRVRESRCTGVSDQEEAGAVEEKLDCPSSHLRTVVPGEKYNVTLGDAVHVLFVDLDSPHNPLYRAMEAQEASMKPPFPVWEPALPISSRFASRGSCAEKSEGVEAAEDLTKERAEATEKGNEDTETEKDEKTLVELTKRRPQRQLTYEMSLPVTTLNRLLGLPSRAELEERYTAFVLSDASVVIQKDSFVRGLPLSDCFFTRVRYRLTALNAAACASFSFERLREKVRRESEDQLEAEVEENEGKRGEECDGEMNEEQGGTEVPETQLDFEYEVVFVKSTFLQGKISSQGEAQVVEALAQFLQYSREALQAAVETDEERPDTGNRIDGETSQESASLFCHPPVGSSDALFACTTTTQVQTRRRLQVLASWLAGSLCSALSCLFSRAKEASPAIRDTFLNFLLSLCSLSAVLGFTRKLLPSTPFEGFLLVLVCMLYWRIAALETCFDEGL